jgi:ribosomal protein L11 methyltransferase
MTELQWLARQADLPLLEALLEEAQALSVSVLDAAPESDEDHALFGEPDMPAPVQGWPVSRVQALFDSVQAAQQAAARVAQQPELSDVKPLSPPQAVADQDWVRATQAQFEPVAVTDDCYVVPSWHQPPPQARTVLWLDPGLAFGTGSHPTTLMCLRWLAQHSLQDARVLDYGCGSGILAIAAARMGAWQVDAVDIDPDAWRASQDNAANNGVKLHRVGGADCAQGQYHVVLANILATPLQVLAPLLSQHVAPGGTLVLAGILTRQTDALVQAYAPWLALSVSQTMDGWALMTAQCPAPLNP